MKTALSPNGSFKKNGFALLDQGVLYQNMILPFVISEIYFIEFSILKFEISTSKRVRKMAKSLCNTGGLVLDLPF